MITGTTFAKFAAAAAFTTIAMIGFSRPTQTVDTPAHLTAANNVAAGLRSQGEKGEFKDANNVAYNQYGADFASAYITTSPKYKVNAVCANFVTLILQGSYPGWTPKGAGFNSTSPNPAMYHDAIENDQYGFEHVDEFEDIEAGDLLMAKYLDGSGPGHAMIVRNVALLAEDTTTHERMWSVQVIDCSKDTHSNDTREFTKTDGTKFATQGAGWGEMKVVTKDGDITGYSWSFRNGSTFYTPSVRHLTLGRLVN